MDLSNFRKVLAIFISLIFLIIFTYLLFTTNNKTLFAFFVIILIVVLSSDFKILKIGVLKNVYFWIETPEIINQKKKTFEEILDNFKINYFSRKYFDETNNKKLKVIKIEDGYILIDSREVFQKLKNGLRFNLLKEETIDTDNQIVKTFSDPIGSGIIIFVSDISRLKTEWGKNLELHQNPVYAIINIDEDIKESNLDELQKAYESLKNVYFNKWRVD